MYYNIMGQILNNTIALSYLHSFLPNKRIMVISKHSNNSNSFSSLSPSGDTTLSTLDAVLLHLPLSDECSEGDGHHQAQRGGARGRAWAWTGTGTRAQARAKVHHVDVGCVPGGALQLAHTGSFPVGSCSGWRNGFVKFGSLRFYSKRNLLSLELEFQIPRRVFANPPCCRVLVHSPWLASRLCC